MSRKIDGGSIQSVHTVSEEEVAMGFPLQGGGAVPVYVTNLSETAGGLPGSPTRIVLELTQTGTNAPVVTALVNETGVGFTPSYADVGTYLITFSSNVFPAGPSYSTHVVCFGEPGQNAINAPGSLVQATVYDEANLAVLTLNAAGAVSNNVLLRGHVQVDIYP